MKTKLLIALLIGFVCTQLSASDEKNPCGALLCILGGQTSGECKKYYEYYTIGLPKECAKECKYFAGCISSCIPIKQLAHLKNCKLVDAPEGSVQVDEKLLDSYGVTEFTQNLDSTINRATGITEYCSAEILNKRLEQVILRVEQRCDSAQCWDVNIWGYRINPAMTKSCQALSSMKYNTYLNLKYTCNGTFYEETDWQNGYTKKQISKQVYDDLGDGEKFKDGAYYYQKIPINKNCWVNEVNNE